MSRDEWLKSLKVGDKFATASGFGSSNFSIYKIDAETKTRWKVGNNEYTKIDGEHYPRGNGWNHMPVMHQITDEMLEKTKRYTLVTQLKDTVWGKLKTETLEKIKELLETEGSTNG